MRNILNNKRFLLVACLSVGLVTLFSHSLRVEIGSGKNTGSEQTSQAGHQSILVVPSDAVTVNFFSFSVEGLLVLSPVYYPIKKVLKIVPVFQQTTAHYFYTLFRFIISPNGP